MELVVSAIVALIVVGFIGYPLLREQAAEDEPLTALSEEAEELYRRKESTYSALKELEFDFKTGKLSENDYQELEKRYRAEAIEVLEAIDRLETEDARPAKKGAKRMAATSAAAAAAVETILADEAPTPAPRGARRAAAKEKSSATRTHACPECGSTRIPEGAQFCGACGASLAAVAGENGTGNGDGAADRALESPACDECGADLAVGHLFCGACGAEVRS